MRIFMSACVVAALSASHSVAQSQAVPAVAAEWGTVSDGLRMAISSLSSENTPPEERRFSVAIENVADRDVVLNLGYMLANGKVMFPTAVALILADAQGRTRELRYFDRRYPGVAGRVDDFTVALRSGSVYILRLSLDHYSSAATGEVTLNLATGRHRMAARFDARGASSLNLDTQGIGLMHFWKGTLRSNSVDFVTP
jgi:hypothetical protein